MNSQQVLQHVLNKCCNTIPTEGQPTGTGTGTGTKYYILPLASALAMTYQAPLSSERR